VNNRQLYILATVLSLLGIATFSYKVLAQKFPLHPANQTLTWNIEVRVRFQAL
jgi:hypothetical protein